MFGVVQKLTKKERRLQKLCEDKIAAVLSKKHGKVRIRINSNRRVDNCDVKARVSAKMT